MYKCNIFNKNFYCTYVYVSPRLYKQFLLKTASAEGFEISILHNNILCIYFKGTYYSTFSNDVKTAK